MLVIALFVIPLLSKIRFPGESFVSAPGMPGAAVFGAAAVALGYAIQMAWILLRQRDTGDAAGEGIPHAG
jgi:hypothetical protein